MKEHVVTATSFADSKDVETFKKCKAEGMSDAEAFKYGDNGIGCWGDDTTTAEPCCALSPEAMTAKWGSVKAAKHKQVFVSVGGKRVRCVLKDRLPHHSNRIDLNPGACAALGLKPPVKVEAVWRWVT
jgi:hypothetical protein